MNPSIPRALFAIAALLACELRAEPEARPYGWLYEAEANAPQSTCSVIDDARASGKRAVSSKAAWQPLIAVGGLPEGLSGSFELWTRRRGGPVCLKALLPEGGQKELGWTWGEPAKWEWHRAGSFERKVLESGFLFIRDGNGERWTSLDAVAIVTNADLAAAAFAPEPLDVSLEIPWTAEPGGTISARHWAVNDYEILRAKDASETFDGRFRDLAPALVRIHHAGMAETWSNAETRGWDVEKIRASFERMPAYRGTPILVNICTWPKWFHDGSVLPEERHDDFARLCADLVRVFRDELHIPVAYWEVLNEQDNAYEKAGDLPSLWRLLSKVMAAMREADPAAKIGGPALTWPKGLWTDGFLETCGGQIDFLSWHSYASGSRNDATDFILTDRVRAICDMARGAREALARYPAAARAETFLTEYNISWTWETRDPRMANHIGAVFDALVVKGVAEAGLSGAFVWHLKDHIYGLLDGDNTVRPAYHLYRLGARHLVGDMVPAEASDPDALQVLAVRRADGKRAVLLINRSGHPLRLPSAQTLLGAADIAEAEIGPSDFRDLAPMASPAAALNMAPLSLRLFVEM